MSNGFDMCDNHTYLFATEGKDCPCCEIDRIKAELETTQLHLMEEETTRKIWEQDCKKAESQLAEARAENERIGSVLGLQEYTKHIRQEAIKECLEFIDPITQIHVKQRFGLEGVR